MRKSFWLAEVDVDRLLAIKEREHLKNDAAAVRRALQVAYQHLIEGEEASWSLAIENNMLLRAILLEILKSGFDPARNLSEEARAFLQQLRQQIEVQKKGEQS